MPSIKFIGESGEVVSVSVPLGYTVMEAAKIADMAGMKAECGGGAACGTCHVYIDEAFLRYTGTADDLEQELLEDSEAEVRPNSRLACQVKMTEQLEGIAVRIA